MIKKDAKARKAAADKKSARAERKAARAESKAARAESKATRAEKKAATKAAKPASANGTAATRKAAGADKAAAGTTDGASKATVAKTDGDSQAAAGANGAHKANGASAKGRGTIHPDPHVWIKDADILTSADVQVPDRLIDQVIGQDDAVAVAFKAAEQRRNLMLIGDPGTGKSMLAKAMAEVLPATKQKDILVYHNAKSPNNPKVAQVDGGLGRKIVEKYERKANKKVVAWRVFEWAVAIALVGGGLYFGFFMPAGGGVLTFLFSLLLALLFLYFAGQNRPQKEFLVPKLLAEHGKEAKTAPYVDATGSQGGALLGDVRHDPFQSGGLETPAHLRVETGAIHRAHRGVLFIDEINVLRLQSQQALLTAMQDREYAVSGQSQSSSGALIRTESVPCDFILVAAGNLDAVQPPDPVIGVGMHPALRSRIRGYGYEVFVNSIMEDSHANRIKLCQFVAQEVVRDGRIPHFDAPSIAEVIREAQRRSGRTGKLTLRLRELGGLVRTAGDFARSQGAEIVSLEHVRFAKMASRSLEQQILSKEIENNLAVEGDTARAQLRVGAANGSAIVGTGEVGEPAGLVVPIEAAVVSALSRHAGAIVLGPGLKGKASSGVENVGAVLKNLKGAAIADHDIHVDGAFAHADASPEGIGLAAGVAAVSALEGLPIKQSHVFVAEVAVSGDLKPVRATLQRIEAAAAFGFSHVIVPKSLEKSLLVDAHIREQIQIVYCDTFAEAVSHAIEATDDVRGKLLDRLLQAQKAEEEAVKVWRK